MSETEELVLSLIIKYNISLNPDKGSDFSDEVTSICQWILCTFVCQLISLFGIVTNIINIICFVKQGFKDPVNVSLFVRLNLPFRDADGDVFVRTRSDCSIFNLVKTSYIFLKDRLYVGDTATVAHSLALADLGCLVTLIWTNICYTPALSALDLPFDPMEFQYLTSGMPHTIFTRITGWITAVITLERCLCITAPLKVRNVVTSKRVTFLIIIISLVLLSSAAPLYMVNSLGIKYFPSRNKTLLGLIVTEDRVNVEIISFTINNVLIPVGAFSVITICTIKLVTKLHKLTKWREQSTSSAQSDNVSTRNQKVAKMVVMISTLFISCFVPISIMFVAAVVEPGFSIDGKYKNMLIAFAGVAFVLEATNSSVNIFIYYHMSSKYRDILNGMCCFRSTNIPLKVTS